MHPPTQFSSYPSHFHSIASSTSLPLRTSRYLVTNTADCTFETISIGAIASSVSSPFLPVHVRAPTLEFKGDSFKPRDKL